MGGRGRKRRKKKQEEDSAVAAKDTEERGIRQIRGIGFSSFKKRHTFPTRKECLFPQKIIVLTGELFPSPPPENREQDFHQRRRESFGKSGVRKISLLLVLSDLGSCRVGPSWWRGWGRPWRSGGEGRRRRRRRRGGPWRGRRRRQRRKEGWWSSSPAAAAGAAGASRCAL